MRLLAQTAVLTRAGFGTIKNRFGMSLVTIIGIAAVVAVLVSFLAMGVGVREMATRNIRPDRAVILSKGSLGAGFSSMPRATIEKIASAPGIKKDASGHPLVFSSVEVAVALKKTNGALVNMPIAGVSPNFPEIYPEFHIAEGRMVKPGLREILLGRYVREQFPELGLGSTLRLRGSDWQIVGFYTANNSAWENYLMGDADTVAASFGRDSVQRVTVVLDSPSAFDGFKKQLLADPTAQVDVVSDSEFSQMGLAGFVALLNFIGYFIGGVMAVGATMGALNTMYAAADNRRTEIATLRALGFNRIPVVISVMAESFLLALAGALLGGAIAWASFDGNVAATNGLAFSLHVTPALLAFGITWALLIGLFGALHPAIRIARMPVATALAVK